MVPSPSSSPPLPPPPLSPGKETSSGSHDLCNSARQEALDVSTTVDPSFIIKLIRQLLPPVDMQHALRSPSKTLPENEPLTERSYGEKTSKEEDTKEASEHRPVDQADLHENLGDNKRTFISDHACKSPGKNIDSQDGSNDTLEASGPVHSTDPNGLIPSNSGDEILKRRPSQQQDSDQLVKEHMPSSHDLEEQREEAGCMLWDLAANQSHAEFMVKHCILDVLLGILNVSHTDRLREICLGVMGNLACHATPVKAIVETRGLQSKIVQCLFVDDAPSLSEACRLLSAGLHSEEIDSWVEALRSHEVLERVIWIAANTMNSLLLEKSTELLLAMVDCQGNSALLFVSVLVHLGLPSVLTDLLASEISGMNEGSCLHGSVILDTLLQIAEALSLSDEVAAQLAANSTLLTLACQVIQLSGKDEVGPAGISAAVLVANLLAEEENLIFEVSNNVMLIKQLMELLPLAADDLGARNALWSILSRLSRAFKRILEEQQTINPDILSVLAERCDVLFEDVQDHQDEKMEGSEDTQNTKGIEDKLETIKQFLFIMEGSTPSHESVIDEGFSSTIQQCCSFIKQQLREFDVGILSEHDDGLISHKNGPGKEV